MARTARQIKEQTHKEVIARTTRDMLQEQETVGEKDIFASLTAFITDTVSTIKWTSEQQALIQSKVEQLYDLQAQVYNTASEIKETLAQTPQASHILETTHEPEIITIDDIEQVNTNKKSEVE